MANNRNYPNSLSKRLNVTGIKIHQYREKINLSQQELSNKLIILGIDIPAKSIYHIEAGTRTVADFELCAIAKVLKVPVQYFLDDYYNLLDNIYN